MSFLDYLREVFSPTEYEPPEVTNYSHPVNTGYEPEPPTWHNDFGTAPDYSVPASSSEPFSDFGSSSFSSFDSGNSWSTFE